MPHSSNNQNLSVRLKYCRCPSYIEHPQSKKCGCLDTWTPAASRAPFLYSVLDTDCNTNINRTKGNCRERKVLCLSLLYTPCQYRKPCLIFIRAVIYIHCIDDFTILENTPCRTGLIYNVAHGTFTFSRRRQRVERRKLQFLFGLTTTHQP